jgi:hypothetical protein
MILRIDAVYRSKSRSSKSSLRTVVRRVGRHATTGEKREREHDNGTEGVGTSGRHRVNARWNGAFSVARSVLRGDVANGRTPAAGGTPTSVQMAEAMARQIVPKAA